MCAVGLVFAFDGTSNYFKPKTVAIINKPTVRGVVFKPDGEAIGQFESYQIMVKNGIVYFRDPATSKIYTIPTELVVLITPMDKQIDSRMIAGKK